MENFLRLFGALRMAAAVLAALSLACAVGLAQEEEVQPPEPPAADVPVLPDVLKEGTLELKARLYLPDGKGDPRFVPNMLLGDLLDMIRAQASRSEGADLPTYSFDNLAVQAKIDSDVADVTARAQVTLGENALPVTAIGLRLHSCQLSQPIEFEGGGQSQWQVGRSEPGYTWWLKAEPNTTHHATLVGQSVLVTEGDRQSLPLSLPAAPVTIDLYLPAGCQDVRVRGQGDELLRSEANEGAQKYVVRCNGGDINISWRSGNDGQPVVGAAAATSETTLRIDDPREAWEAESEIKLRAYGESPIDSLTIELPEGARWLPSPPTSTEQYTITEVQPTAAASPADASSSATVAGEKPAGEAKPAALRAAGQRVRLTIRALSRTGLSALKAIPVRWRWTPPKSSGEVLLSNVAVPSITVRAVDRHDGWTTLSVPAAYALDWKSQQGTELVTQLKVPDLEEQLQYVFRFARQPLGLVVSFRRETNLAKVRPTYLAEVDRGKVMLTGWFECDFDRSQRPELALALGDWTLDSAQPISDMSVPYEKTGDMLTQETLPEGFIKLSNDLDVELAGSGRRQRQVWRIVAYRSLTEGSIEHLKLSVPGLALLAPDGMRSPVEHMTGALLMAASDNVLLSWDERNSQSLLADTVSSAWTNLLPEALAERAMAYRFQAGTKQSPVWSGRVEVLPQRIAAEQVAVVHVDLDAARISQKFTLQIANEPLQRLQLITRGPLDGSVLVNTIPCVLEQTLAPPEAGVPADQTLLTVVGAPKLFGKVEVEVRWQMPLPAIAAESQNAAPSSTPPSSAAPSSASLSSSAVAASSASTSDSLVGATAGSSAGVAEAIVQLPLVRLDLPDAQLANRAQVSITADRRLNVSIGTQAVSSDSSASATGGNPPTWSPLPGAAVDIPSDEETLLLRIRRLSEIDPLPVRVSGAWLQTAVNGTTRLDRFCARFRTEQQDIAIILPSSDLLSAQVALDGVQINGVPSSQGRLQIDVRSLDAETEHTLEVWTRSATTLGWLNRIDVVPVVIEGGQQIDHFYWQLVTPASQHLVEVPESLTPEWRWVWDRLWWHRLSPQDQAFFEQWLKASEQPPLAESANRYVVSSYGPVREFHCWTASRMLLWLPVGLVAIGCALAVSSWRRLRHPASAIAVAGLVSLLATAWPDLAILVGQTTLLALVIVMLYALTQAAVESRVRRRSVFTTRPASAMLESGDHHSLVRPGSHASSEIMATTRTQGPIVADGGGH